jgi:hypothetical protein
LSRWRKYFFQLLNVHGVNDVRQTEIHTTEHLVPQPSAFEVEMPIEELKSHKSPGIDQIPAEMNKTGSIKIPYEIYRLIISIWKKEELPEEWKESIIVPIYKKGDKKIIVFIGHIFFANYIRNLSNILLSRLTPYAEEIIGDHESRFRHNSSTTDHIFCIRQILEKKWEYNDAVHQHFIDLKEAYGSVWSLVHIIFSLRLVFP